MVTHEFLGRTSEAMHTFLDILVTTITLIAVSVGSKPPDREHPFGHGKAESIGGLFGSLFIIIAGILIGYESAERIIMKVPFSLMSWPLLLCP